MFVSKGFALRIAMHSKHNVIEYTHRGYKPTRLYGRLHVSIKAMESMNASTVQVLSLEKRGGRR